MRTSEPVCVAGASEHPIREAPDRSEMQLHAEVAAGVLDDTGLAKDTVDADVALAHGIEGNIATRHGAATVVLGREDQ